MAGHIEVVRIRYIYINVISPRDCYFLLGHRVINMSFQCEDCGCIYEWENFFNNHRRTVHGFAATRGKRTRFSEHFIDFLDSYYTAMCDRPTLQEIKGLATFLDIKKEAVYFWFANRRQKEKRLKAAHSLKQDVNNKRRVDRVPSGTLEGGKRAKTERN